MSTLDVLAAELRANLATRVGDRGFQLEVSRTKSFVVSRFRVSESLFAAMWGEDCRKSGHARVRIRSVFSRSWEEVMPPEKAAAQLESLVLGWLAEG